MEYGYKGNQVTMFALHLCQFFLYLMAGNIMLVSIGFLFGITISWVTLPLSFAVSVIALVFFYDKPVGSIIIWEILTAAFILGTLMWICGNIYDQTYDGNYYHKLATGLLQGGWNPLTELPQNRYSDIIVCKDGTSFGSGNIWVEAYSKATWIFGASIYAVTGNIETGKAFTLIGMLCVFFITVVFLKAKNKSNVFCLLFALAATLNPVAVSQFRTFYVDGFLYTILYILVVCLIMQAQEIAVSSKISWSMIASTMVICGNIKFTGLMYGGIFCIAYFVWFCVNHCKQQGWRPDWKLYFRRMTIFAGIALATVVWAGNSSYITNFLRYRNFLYPVFGKDKIDIMTPNSPFEHANHFKNFFISLFSKMSNPAGEEAWKSNLTENLKIPFTIDLNTEWGYLGFADTRLSGFGFFFSGIFLIAIVIILIQLIQMKKNQSFYFLFMNLFVCLALTFGLTESWWARYAPYVYFIVLISMYLALDAKHKILQMSAYGFAALVILNGAIFLQPLPKHIVMSQQIRTNLQELKNYEGNISVFAQNYDGCYFNLRDLGVYYQVDSQIASDKDTITTAYMGIIVKAKD